MLFPYMYRRYGYRDFSGIFFCKRDMNFLMRLNESYFGTIVLQTILFILQKKPQSITNFTKLISDK